jgi:hypothetical protein
VTLLFMDGCQGGDRTSRYVASSGTRTTTTPRFAGGAYYNAASLNRPITPSAEVITSAAVYWSGTSSPTCYLYGDSGAQPHIAVFRNASGLLQVVRAPSSTVLATGTTVVSDGWHHLQFRGTIADSGGIAQVRLDGATTNEIDFTGDTRNAGTSTNIDAVWWSSGSGYFLTDIVIFNSAGTVNNSWMGDCRVQTLLPTGNGNTSQGVGSDADSVNNYQLVDEVPFSSTDYVGVTTDGQGDTYSLSDLATGTNSVKGIQTSLNVAKSDAGTKSVKRRVRSGGTTYTGPSVALGTTYNTVIEVLELDPATSAAWTVSSVNALEAGFEAAT